MYDSTFLEKFSGDTALAESWIDKSLEIAKGYLVPFGSFLTIDQIGKIGYEDTAISIKEVQSEKLRDMTLQKRGNAHMIVYYIGPSGEKIGGRAGCIGCVCRPDRTISSKSGWVPRGGDPDFKHCMVEKTRFNDKQGKVRSFK